MRLGEASGATLALGVLKAAAACHTGMATFAEAGVSGAGVEPACLLPHLQQRAAMAGVAEGDEEDRGAQRQVDQVERDAR